MQLNSNIQEIYYILATLEGWSLLQIDNTIKQIEKHYYAYCVINVLLSDNHNKGII